ncbi:hypothetical protein Emed_003993 [Eimeria media]
MVRTEMNVTKFDAKVFSFYYETQCPTLDPPKLLVSPSLFFITVLLAGLALTYLLLTCMRHLSKNVSLSSHQVRLLASKFPNEDEDGDRCPAPFGGDGDESATSTAQGDTGLAELAEALGAAQLEDTGAPALPDPPVQSRRRLPPVTQTFVEKTLLLLRQPAAVVTPILEHMKPDQCLSMVRTLCSSAAVELSAFATVPSSLQPLRQQAAAAYAALIDQVLSIGATADEAQRMGWRGDMLVIQRLLHRLADTPPESEKLPTQFYTTIMKCQQRVSHWMFSQVLHVLHTVADVVTSGYTAGSDEVTSQQLQVLSALCRVRLHQTLNSPTTRHWIQRQQLRLRTNVVYTPSDMMAAVSQNPGTTKDRIEAVTNAVLAAGGLPTTVWAPLPLTSEEQQQLQAHQTLPQQLHQQQLHQQQLHQPPQGIPRLRTAKTDGLLPTPPMPPLAGQPPMVPQTPYAMPHHHQPPLAQQQTLLPFNPAQQDAGFPVINPDPQLSSHHAVSEEAPEPQILIPLPFSYYFPHLPVPVPLEPSTSSSATTAPGGLSGDFSAHSHHSGSTGQPHATQPTPQQMPTSAPKISSSEDEDAR